MSRMPARDERPGVLDLVRHSERQTAVNTRPIGPEYARPFPSATLQA